MFNKGHFANLLKSVAMATSLEELEKESSDRENSRKYLSYGKKIAKIVPVDAEKYSVS